MFIRKAAHDLDGFERVEISGENQGVSGAIGKPLILTHLAGDGTTFRFDSFQASRRTVTIHFAANESIFNETCAAIRP